MTIPVKPVSVPVNIEVVDGTVITTTIDPTTGKHKATCDICKQSITLTVAANPQRLFQHRNKCVFSQTSQWGQVFDQDDPTVYCLPTIPGPMIVDMHITKAEEGIMGIECSNTESHRRDFELPQSDSVEALRAQVAQAKRARTKTVSRVEPDAKRRLII